MAEQVIFFRVEAEGVGDLVDQLGLLRREATSLQKDMRKATDPAEYVKLNRELENNRAAQKATTAAIKEQQKATQQAVQFAEGSYAQLNQQLVGLRKEIKQLSAADRESKLGQTMLANIQKLDAELKDLDASMGQYQRNVGNYESAFSGFAGTLLQIGAVAEVAQFFDPNALIQQGIAIDNLDAKAKTVFGETLPRVTKEAEKNASAMGLTTREYINAAAQLQDLLVPMGFTRDAAAGISTQLQNLSGALSEWTGGQKSASEVSEILSAALLGERDSLKSLGISISQADVDAALLAKGQEKLTGAALQQAQAQATLDLVLQKSTDAQAAFAAGTDSPIRQLAILKAEISTLAENIAEGATPALNGLIKVFLGLSDFVQNNKAAFLAAGVAVGGYTLAVNASAVATAAARVAQLALNVAINAAPYVAVAGAVFALSKVVMDYAFAAEEASITTQTVAESTERMGSAIASGTLELAKETAAVRSSFEVLKSETATRQEKAEVTRKLREQYPDLLKSYSLEKGNLQEIEKAERAIITARAEKIAQRATESEIENLTKSLIAANQELQKVEQQAVDVNKAFAESNKRVDESSVLGFYLSGEVFDRTQVENAKKDSDAAIKAAQERIAALQGQIQTVGSGTNQVAAQLVQALKDVPVAATQAGADAGNNLVKEITDKGGAAADKAKTEQVKTLATLQAELAKYREEFAALNDKSLAPVALLDALQSLPKQIEEVQKKIADLAFSEMEVADRLKLIKFTPTIEDLDTDALENRPVELPVAPVITPRTLQQVRDELAKVQAEIQGFGTQGAIPTETIQRFESLTNEVERLQKALETLNGTPVAAPDEAATATGDKIDPALQKRLDDRKKLEDQLKQAAIDAAQAASDAIFEIENENLERITDKKLKQLEEDEAAALNLVQGNAQAEQQVREDYAAQREQIEREAFEKKKQLDTAQAIINAALAITQVFASTPFPASLIAAALVTAQTAAQIATIQAAQFALGGRIGDGFDAPKAEHGIFVGPSHSGGGINTRLSGRRVNVEGGEFFERLSDGSSIVVNKKSTSAFKRALLAQAGQNYPGKLSTLSAINQYGGGVPLMATGGIVTPMAGGGAQSTAQMELLGLALDKLSNRVPVLTLQSFDTVNSRATQVKTLQGL